MQFGLRTLFLVFFVLASAFAAFGPAGFVVAPWLIGVTMCFRIAFARRNGAALALGLILLFGPLCLLPAVSNAREPARRVVCSNNLRQIGAALRNYADGQSCLPPAYVPDATGRPMHSWRVLLLPYVEEGALYQQYHFDEPWDGPNNRKLATIDVMGGQCPSQPFSTDDRPAPTHYVAVTGPGTAWPGEHGCPARAIEDPANTILLVEVDRSDIVWFEPRDLAIDDVLHDEQGLAGAIRSRHGSADDSYFVRGARGGHVLTADGMSHYLAGQPSAEDLAELVRIDGPKKVTIDNVVLRSEPSIIERIRWDHVVGLPLFVISFLLLVCRPLPKRSRPDAVKGQDSQP